MPAEAVERVVRHALFRYRDPKRGTLRTAYRGDTILVCGEDLKRGEKFEAFLAEGESLEPVTVEEPGESSDGEPEDGDELPRPPLAANKDAWVDYRFAQQDGRVSREQLADMTKEQLQDDDTVVVLQPPA